MQLVFGVECHTAFHDAFHFVEVIARTQVYSSYLQFIHVLAEEIIEGSQEIQGLRFIYCQHQVGIETEHGTHHLSLFQRQLAQHKMTARMERVDLQCHLCVQQSLFIGASVQMGDRPVVIERGVHRIAIQSFGVFLQCQHDIIPIHRLAAQSVNALLGSQTVHLPCGHQLQRRAPVDVLVGRQDFVGSSSILQQSNDFFGLIGVEIGIRQLCQYHMVIGVIAFDFQVVGNGFLHLTLAHQVVALLQQFGRIVLFQFRLSMDKERNNQCRHEGHETFHHRLGFEGVD